MSFHVKPDSMMTPECQERSIYTGSSWELGALLYVDVPTGTWRECGADPTIVQGVAECAAGAGVITSGALTPLGVREFPPGKMQATLVKPNTKFLALYSGTLPAQAGDKYGVVRDANGVWRVDFSDTTNDVVLLVRIFNTDPLAFEYVEVTFITAELIEA